MIVEILNEDGSMARRPDLEAFAEQHHLKIGTIADLIHYRIQYEKTVERVSEQPVKTEYGEFRLVVFRDTISNQLHLALVHGVPRPDKATPVRVHLQKSLDPLALLREEGGWSQAAALRYIATQESGVVVILRRPDSAQSLLQDIEHYQSQQKGLHWARMVAPGVLPPATLMLPCTPEGGADLRTYGIGAQILKDLGVCKMRVLGTPMKIHALSGFDLEVVEYVTKD